MRAGPFRSHSEREEEEVAPGFVSQCCLSHWCLEELRRRVGQLSRASLNLAEPEERNKFLSHTDEPLSP